MSALNTNLEAQTLIEQNKIISAFFKSHTASELVASLNAMIEAYLFGRDLENVSPEMWMHIVNQLRVATLVAKLGDLC